MQRDQPAGIIRNRGSITRTKYHRCSFTPNFETDTAYIYSLLCTQNYALTLRTFSVFAQRTFHIVTHANVMASIYIYGWVGKK